jgi:nucleoid-associated protein YgaU
MTKENKIALVVGFALILVVGILISDHLSTARSQEPADLLPPARDPLLERGDDPRLLLFPPGESASPASPAAPTSGPTGGAMTAQGPASAPPPIIPIRDVPQAPAAAAAFHTIRSGESLTLICQQHYGDGTLARDLARFNNLANPDVVMAGVRLRLPSAEVLRPGGPANPRPATSAATPAARDARGTYTVRSGDVLSVLAQRLLGSARRWQELYEHNRDKIDDPDHLVAGTVLRIPDR